MNKPPRQTMREIFESRLQTLATVLRPASVRQYRVHLKGFLSYLEAAYPEVCRLSQLRRDPHMIGWLRSLYEHQRPLKNKTRLDAIILVRRLLNDLAASKCCGVREGLLIRGDCPPVDKYLPKPLSPEDDHKLEQQLRKNDDLCSNGLLLLRATGMRIGECLNLTVDALRDFGQNQWAIKIPLGKLHNERWVPVDEDACRVFRRILFLRSLVVPREGATSCTTLLLQKDGRPMSYQAMKGRLIAAGRQAGCSSRTTPHRLRHTYGTAMLRAGASLPAVKELLGHKTITMTLNYVEVNQLDLQREYHRARQEMRFPAIPKINKTRENLSMPTLLHSLAEVRHLMEMLRRQLPSEGMRRKMARLTNRLDKISAEMPEVDKPEK